MKTYEEIKQEYVEECIQHAKKGDLTIDNATWKIREVFFVPTTNLYYAVISKQLPNGTLAEEKILKRICMGTNIATLFHIYSNWEFKEAETEYLRPRNKEP